MLAIKKISSEEKIKLNKKTSRNISLTEKKLIHVAIFKNKKLEQRKGFLKHKKKFTQEQEEKII